MHWFWQSNFVPKVCCCQFSYWNLHFSNLDFLNFANAFRRNKIIMETHILFLHFLGRNWCTALSTGVFFSPNLVQHSFSIFKILTSWGESFYCSTLNWCCIYLVGFSRWLSCHKLIAYFSVRKAFSSFFFFCSWLNSSKLCSH